MRVPMKRGRASRSWLGRCVRAGLLTVMLVAGYLPGMAVSASAGLTVSPPVLDLHLTPGVRQTFSLEVQPTGVEAGQVRVSYAGWEQDLRGQRRLVPAESSDRSLAGWISVSPSVFELEPGEVQEILLTVDVPPESNGTFWGALVLDLQPRDPSSAVDQGGSEAVVWMTQTVPGTEQPSGRVLRVEALRNGSRGADAQAFEAALVFTNTGNVLVTPRGWLEIRDATGVALWRKRLEEVTVLPGRTVQMLMPYDGPPLGRGRYVLLGVVDYGKGFRVAGQSLLTVN